MIYSSFISNKIISYIDLLFILLFLLKIKMTSQEEEWNDPEFVDEVIKVTEKRERQYDEYNEKTKRFNKGDTSHITSYFFPLIPQPNVTNVSKVYVAKYIPGQPMPKCPNKGRNILIHTSNKYLGGSLSPYHLKTEDGYLLENAWQFAKVYPYVYAQKTSFSRFKPDHIIWEHPTEKHVGDDKKPLKEYWSWRTKGMSTAYAIRYPNGFKARHECIYSLWPTSKCTIGEETDIVDHNGERYKKLTYIEARKAIYCAEYVKNALLTKCFKEIQELMKKGITIQIVEVDGPNVDWYKKSEISSAIRDQSLAISRSVIEYLLNDPKHPFGHGYVIAALLLGGASWMIV
jgi:hypothetical protein